MTKDSPKGKFNAMIKEPIAWSPGKASQSLEHGMQST
jgi:hypothetical protein